MENSSEASISLIKELILTSLRLLSLSRSTASVIANRSALALLNSVGDISHQVAGKISLNIVDVRFHNVSYISSIYKKLILKLLIFDRFRLLL